MIKIDSDLIDFLIDLFEGCGVEIQLLDESATVIDFYTLMIRLKALKEEG